MFKLEMYFVKSFFFLISFGLHILMLGLFYSMSTLKKSDSLVVDIELRENKFQTLAQGKIQKDSEVLTSEKIFKNDDSEQKFSQNQINEGFSDLSVGGSFHQSYLDKVRSKIEFHKTYPKTAKVFKESGLVKVKVQLLKSGHIQKIQVAQSSPFKRLDAAAIKAVADSAPFDEFPSDAKFASWSILIPIRFELNE